MDLWCKCFVFLPHRCVMVCCWLSSLHSHPWGSLGWSGVVVSSAWTLMLLPAETHTHSAVCRTNLPASIFSSAIKRQYYCNTQGTTHMTWPKTGNQSVENKSSHSTDSTNPIYQYTARLIKNEHYWWIWHFYIYTQYNEEPKVTQNEVTFINVLKLLNRTIQ